jgi:hypothetical protein
MVRASDAAPHVPALSSPHLPRGLEPRVVQRTANGSGGSGVLPRVLGAPLDDVRRAPRFEGREDVSEVGRDRYGVELAASRFRRGRWDRGEEQQRDRDRAAHLRGAGSTATTCLMRWRGWWPDPWSSPTSRTLRLVIGSWKRSAMCAVARDSVCLTRTRLRHAFGAHVLCGLAISEVRDICRCGAREEFVQPRFAAVTWCGVRPSPP